VQRALLHRALQERATAIQHAAQQIAMAHHVAVSQGQHEQAAQLAAMLQQQQQAMLQVRAAAAQAGFLQE